LSLLHAHHHNHNTANKSDKNLIIAVGVNLLLTVVQIIGGLVSGSLSLIADAIHNLSDAASLGIALFARIIARRPPDAFKTFGYKRAEIIAALINLTTLILIGIYLIYEAIWRLLEPVEITGWIVIIVATVALLVDIVTAALTYRMSRHSLNIRAAFLHNVADALSSVGVIIAGTCILLFGWTWIDAIIALVIAGYILVQGFSELPKTIHILMDGTPEHLSVSDVIASLENIDGINNVHHVHIRQLDEHSNALEAHIVTDRTVEENEDIKTSIRSELRDKFRIEHSTLEFEHPNGTCCEPVHDNH
jgi:cobalt-zinc-cadmium efflux system protein